MQTTQKWYQEIAKPQPPNTNSIWSCTFNTDGALLFVTISDILVVYNADNGDVVTKPTKAAKDVINCIAFSKDGKTFATSSNDKSVVLWKFNIDAQKKIEPLLKFSQGDAILTLAFNPLTHQLFTGGAVDFALYTPGKQDIPKEKYKQKILCSAWSPDGQTLAFGTMNGTISFRQRNLDQKNEVKKLAPIWCLQWTPITSDHQQSYLLVGCWDRTFYYFNHQGQMREKIAQKRIPFNPISLSFHPSGEFFLVSGTNKKISIFTRDLGFLTELMQLKDWSWSAKFRPKSMQIAVTTNDGLITMQQLSKKPIFSNYQELFASRDNLTDIIVQNLLINQKLRIKCKELVKKISIFKDKLAVLQNQRLLIYIASQQSLKYNPFRKITKQFDCDFMGILNSHVVFGKNSKIQLFNLIGELEKEWVLESQITYLKALGGPAKRQHFVVGLKNGQIFKIFVDNSFPILLYKSSASIRCCDLNLNKKKLALVDTNNNLLVIDLITQAQLYQEMGIFSCVWNSDLQDTLAYSGGGILSIRTGSMPALTQKTEANVLGFKGFQLFVLKQDKISIMDVSQSSTLIKFIEKKDYKTAYKLACLGVTENDIRMLGIEALQNMDFEIADKCFIRLKDLPFIELSKKYAQLNKQGKMNENFLKAQVLAYQGKYQQAANIYIKAGASDQAMRLFSQLKRFEEAQRFIKSSGKSEDNETRAVVSGILNQQAQWAKQNGDWKTAANLYISSRNYKKAIDIYGKQNYLDGLIQVCRMIDKADNEANLITCANIFRKNKNHAYSKEAYLKLGDVKNLMSLHVEMERWQEAFLLGRQNKQLLEIAKLPYANYLLKTDKYQQALRAFKSLGRYDLTSKMLINLANNAVSEKRYVDAGRHYWTMAIQQLKSIKDLKNITKQEQPFLNKFNQHKNISQIYFVYNSINTFVESPFFTSSQSALYTILNGCRFLICKIGSMKLPYINLSYIYYSLAKVSKLLEGYKTARSCYQKLAQLKVPSKWADQIDLGSLLVRSKPYSDKQNILPICNRCFMANPVISDKDSCFSCKHPFIMSFVSFQILPLVEFKVESGVSHSKVLELLGSEKVTNKKNKQKGKKDDGWSQSKNEKHQILSFKLNKGTQQIENTPFYEKMSQAVEQQQAQLQYTPIILGPDVLATIDIESVYYLDMRKINPSSQIRYFKNLVPDLLLKCCNECGKFFLLDEYEFEYVQTKRCPFCNIMDKRAGNSKDIFDV